MAANLQATCDTNTVSHTGNRDLVSLIEQATARRIQHFTQRQTDGITIDSCQWNSKPQGFCQRFGRHAGAQHDLVKYERLGGALKPNFCYRNASCSCRLYALYSGTECENNAFLLGLVLQQQGKLAAIGDFIVW